MSGNDMWLSAMREQHPASDELGARMNDDLLRAALDRLDNAASDYVYAVTEYLNPANQFTDSRRHAMTVAGAEVLVALKQSREALGLSEPKTPAAMAAAADRMDEAMG